MIMHTNFKYYAAAKRWTVHSTAGAGLVYPRQPVYLGAAGVLGHCGNSNAPAAVLLHLQSQGVLFQFKHPS